MDNKIFITLGSQKFQFNRLLKAVDELCEKGTINAEDVFAQIGYSDYLPKNFSYKKFLDRDEFSNEMEKANIVITHGGTGAIIGAVKKGKKVIAVPSDIYSTTGEGTNQLIYNGSEIYLSPKQLIIQELIPDSISINKDDENKIAIGLKDNRHFSESELTILSYLSNDDKTIDQISELMNKKPFELIECLSMLEIENIIKILPDGRILRGQN